jgi:hypothetical protein
MLRIRIYPYCHESISERVARRLSALLVAAGVVFASAAARGKSECDIARTGEDQAAGSPAIGLCPVLEDVPADFDGKRRHPKTTAGPFELVEYHKEKTRCSPLQGQLTVGGRSGLSPSKYSITRKSMPSCRPTSWRMQIFGRLRLETAHAAMAATHQGTRRRRQDRLCPGARDRI